MTRHAEAAQMDLCASELYPSRLPALLVDVASRAGVTDLSQPELRTMQVIPFVTRKVDDHVDIPPFPEDVNAIVDELIAGRAVPDIGVGKVQAEEFGLLYAEHLDPQGRARLLEVLRTLPDFARQHRGVQSMQELIACRLAECAGFASLLMLRVTPGAASERGRTRYNAWMDQIAKAGYLIDSLADIRRDRASGRISFRPTALEIAQLATLTVAECSRTLARTPVRSLSYLGRSAMSTLVKTN